MRPLLFVLLFCSIPAALAQPVWEAAGVPIRTFFMTDIFTDTIGDAIYFCGESSWNNNNDFNTQGVSVYSNSDWDTLGPFAGPVRCATRWHDTLVFGGEFISIEGLPIRTTAALVNGNWLPFGTWPDVEGGGVPRKFKTIDDELYMIGIFDSVDGHWCNGLAKRVGGQWQPVGDMSDINGDNFLSDICIYQGQLVIAGAISFGNEGNHSLGILNNGVWEPLGPGILGSFGQARSLCVYQGDLYVGGAIAVQDGNAGHGIMRWDGDQFHPVSDGLQGMYNDFSTPTGIVSMRERNGLLIGVGQFRYAGHVPAMGVATWDGTQWCGFGGEPRLVVESYDFYHDTLFIGPFHSVDEIEVNSAARYIGSYPYTCTPTAVAVPEELVETHPRVIIDASTITIFAGSKSAQFQLFDAAGRLVSERSGSTVSFPRDGLLPGIYWLHATGFRSMPVCLE